MRLCLHGYTDLPPSRRGRLAQHLRGMKSGGSRLDMGGRKSAECGHHYY